ncbi:MAG: hypothetical protein IIY04_03255, partial [Oscillospiraceae bacterium]|nr:hypothetical protein [Oscillospiraceae bacterium]
FKNLVDAKDVPEAEAFQYFQSYAASFAQEGDRIVCADKTYTVCRAEHMVFGNEELYTWGLLREIGGSAVWKN